MKNKLGRTYYGFAAAALVGCLVLSAPTEAGAGGQQSAFAIASGYSADANLSAPARARSGSRAEAVGTCLEAATARYDGTVSLAQVNRAWRGTGGWIVDLSLDVAREGKRSRRRDVACRQSAHGLQVARY